MRGFSTVREMRLFMRWLLCLLLLGQLTTTPGASAPGDPHRATSHLVELVSMDPRLQLDIRYATKDNFMGFPLYKEARAFLQEPAARALMRAHDELRVQGYGLRIFDGYRPWRVTKLMWDATPDDKKEFVADPAKGSRHNRGCAVDLTLVDLKSGQPVEMPSSYDEFTPRAYADYPGGDPAARARRDLLRRVMEKNGFTVYPQEWWHFDFRGWERYPVLDVEFDQVEGQSQQQP